MKALNLSQLANLREILDAHLNRLVDSPITTLKTIKADLVSDLAELEAAELDRVAADDYFGWSLSLSSNGQRFTLERALRHALAQLDRQVDSLNAAADSLVSKLQESVVVGEPMTPPVTLGQLVVLQANAATPEDAEAAGEAVAAWLEKDAQSIAFETVQKLTRMEFNNAVRVSNGVAPEALDLGNVLERAIVETMLRDIFDNGYRVRIGGEDGPNTDVIPTIGQAKTEIFAEWYEVIEVFAGVECEGGGQKWERIASIWIVWGNGADVISDYNVSLDELGLMSTSGRVAEILGCWDWERK